MDRHFKVVGFSAGKREESGGWENGPPKKPGLFEECRALGRATGSGPISRHKVKWNWVQGANQPGTREK